MTTLIELISHSDGRSSLVFFHNLCSKKIKIKETATDTEIHVLKCFQMPSKIWGTKSNSITLDLYLLTSSDMLKFLDVSVASLVLKSGLLLRFETTNILISQNHRIAWFGRDPRVLALKWVTSLTCPWFWVTCSDPLHSLVS